MSSERELDFESLPSPRRDRMDPHSYPRRCPMIDRYLIQLHAPGPVGCRSGLMADAIGDFLQTKRFESQRSYVVRFRR